MKLQRTLNAKRNILSGGMLRLITMVLAFLMRTLMIRILGVEYLGLNGLFTSVLSVLNIAELGISSAIDFALYKPIADDDIDKVCAILKIYKKYYGAIGTIILIVGLVLTPFLPHLISGDVPDGINIYVLYIMYLLYTSTSYWMFCYKTTLLYAHQRADVYNILSTVITFMQYVAQAIILIVLRNYYLYVVVTIISMILINISCAGAASKMYPQYTPRGQLEKSEVRLINGKIRDLFTSKIGGIIVNSSDSIVISAFLGLSAVAIYNNYYYIMSSVIGILAMAFTACTAAIGNSLVTETKEKNLKDLNKFTFMVAWVAGVCSCCFLVVYQPFMKVWVGENNIYGFPVVICFCIYFYVYEINQLLCLYKNGAGIWHEDRFRPLITGLVNLALNLITVKFIGIYGVILSTVISTLFIGLPWLINNVFGVLFKSSCKKYVFTLLLYMLSAVCTCVISYIICSFITVNGILEIVIKLLIGVVLPNIIFWLLYNKKAEFHQTVEIVRRMVSINSRIPKCECHICLEKSQLVYRQIHEFIKRNVSVFIKKIIKAIML